MRELWISPSDLSYFLSDSKVGFYDKYVLNILRPKGVFPSVFNTIDQGMKDCFDSKPIADFVEGAPTGILRHNEEYVQSQLVKLDDNFSVGFKGKIDSLLDHEDGTHTVIDYKTTHLSDKLKEIYWLQLMAYAFCLEKPLMSTPKKISNIGLIVFQPTLGMEATIGKASLNGSLHYVDLNFDKKRFKEWLAQELLPLLNQERDGIFVSYDDKSWARYVNCFHLEDVEEVAVP